MFNQNLPIKDYQNHIEQKQNNQKNNCQQQVNQQITTNQLKGVINQGQKLNKIDSHKSSFYRPDIDGLRTIAVLIVVIFHAWPDKLPGGFIGVDIFFVISGFLISGIIIKQNNNNKFSYAVFYKRRINRIYPSLIVVMLFVLSISLWKLLRRPLQIVTHTLAAAAFFAANLQVLTYQKGYFDPDVKTNPLLHLWSLGVQQQFYIIWPFIIYILLKRFKKFALHGLFGFTIFSFLFSIFSIYLIATKFAFYFPLCRFWQMSIGGILAYIKYKIFNKKINEILSLISLISILITIFILNEQNLFPGFWALIPSLSAAIIIITEKSFINKIILSNKLFVFIGKISYPLYLWHWPLLVFQRTLNPPGNPLFMVITSFILSILTYYLIQNKLRFRKQKIIVFMLFFSIILIGVVSYIIYSNENIVSLRQNQIIDNLRQIQKNLIPTQQDTYKINGRILVNSSKNKKRKQPSVQKILYQLINYPYRQINVLQKRIPKQSRYYDNEIDKNCQNFDISNQNGKNKLFIIGDSHARIISHRFQELYLKSLKNSNQKEFPTIVTIASSSLPYLPFSHIFDTIFNYIKQHKPQRIFIENRWKSWLTYDESKVQSQKDVLYTIQGFSKRMIQIKNLGIQIYVNTIIIDSKKLHPLLMVDLQGVIQQRTKPLILSQFKNQNQKIINLLENKLKQIKVNIIDYSSNLCWQDKCQVLIPQGVSIFRDDNHFSNFYSKYWINVVDFLTEF